MNNQVLSIEQCKELIELGIDMSNASMCYFIGAIEELVPIYGPVEYSENEYIPTFTLQDILEMLPSEWTFVKDYCDECDRDPQTYFLFIEIGALQDKHGVRCDTMLECAFNMLKWCKQNNYI